MTQPPFKLVRPHTKYRESYLSGLAELKTESEKDAWLYLGDMSLLWFPEENFEGYVAELLKRETHPPSHFVPDLIFWAVRDGEVWGRISLRHPLNEFLKKLGGHIGYVVRPSQRGKGVATEMLRQMLLVPKAQAVGRLFLTCDEDNIASEKTILKNGGVLQDCIEVGPGKPWKKRFWIDLAAKA